MAVAGDEVFVDSWWLMCMEGREAEGKGRKADLCRLGGRSWRSQAAARQCVTPKDMMRMPHE